MTTRYDAKSQPRFGVPGLPSGYDGDPATDITIPSCGIKDVDEALFRLFDKEIPLIVSGENVAENRRCPVIFFAGEKWALVKKLRALRDRNGALILPICTAVRTSIAQDVTQDVTGRGINQQTGEIVVRRRLDPSDRGYQQLINRTLIAHQQDLAVSPELADPGQLTTTREIGDLADDPIVQQGGLLFPNRANNVFETIVIPAPQFFTATYDVTIWAQYTSHMNQLLEQLIASQLSQGNCWRLTTPKGYWFIAKVVDGAYTADTNTDDFSQTERVIKHKFTIKVPGYVLATSVAGAPVPLKRYVSCPIVSFTVDASSGVESLGDVVDPFLGADDPTLPLDAPDDGVGNSHRVDQRMTNATRLCPPLADVTSNTDDPALKGVPKRVDRPRFKRVVGIDKDGKTVTKLLRVNGARGPQGETALSANFMLGGFSIVSVDDLDD